MQQWTASGLPHITAQDIFTENTIFMARQKNNSSHKFRLTDVVIVAVHWVFFQALADQISAQESV